MIVLGAGGHAKELVADFIDNNLEVIKLAMYDTVNLKLPDYFLNHNAIHIKSEAQLINYFENHNNDQAYIAVGNGYLRYKLYLLATQLRLNIASFISQNAFVDASSQLGLGLNIMANSYVGPNTQIGNGTLVNNAAHIHHDCSIGEFCEIAPGAKVLGGCKLGNNVLVGSNAVVLPGVSICSDVKIGALTVVTKSIINPGTYVGNAKAILKE